MSPGIDHDDVIIVFEFFSDTQPGQAVFIEAMQEQQCGLVTVTSSAIVVVTYAIGEDIALAPVCREKFNDGTICFHKSLQLCIGGSLLLTHLLIRTGSRSLMLRQQ